MADQIAVINASTVLSDQELATMVEAVQAQIDQHFGSAWGIPAALQFIPRGVRPPADMWWMAVLDDADQAGALGYHDITSAGLPLGKVFARTDQRYGYLVSVTLSHESSRCSPTPDVNLLVQDGRRVRRFWAYEICDAVETDGLGYAINGIQVSDFVLPEYFETFRTGVQTDYRGHLRAPVPALTAGGYMAYVENGTWHQVFAEVNRHAMRRRAQIISGLARRRADGAIDGRSRARNGSSRIFRIEENEWRWTTTSATSGSP